MNKTRIFGLLGKELTHSYSAQYFNKKFYTENIKYVKYLNFELNNAQDFQKLIKKKERS